MQDPVHLLLSTLSNVTQPTRHHSLQNINKVGHEEGCSLLTYVRQYFISFFLRSWVLFLQNNLDYMV